MGAVSLPNSLSAFYTRPTRLSELEAILNTDKGEGCEQYCGALILYNDLEMRFGRQIWMVNKSCFREYTKKETFLKGLVLRAFSPGLYGLPLSVNC